MTEFQIYALDASDCRISVCRDTKDFSNQQGRGKFQVQRDKMLTALRPDGSLLLFCEVEFLPPGIKLNVEKEDDEIIEESNTDSAIWVQESLREMWQQETFTDCIIQVFTHFSLYFICKKITGWKRSNERTQMHFGTT
jgi:hypothetical protein